MNDDARGVCFLATYRLSGTAQEAAARAQAIGVEQTAEFPVELLPEALRSRIVGEVIAFSAGEDGYFLATLAYPVATAGQELPQLLNVLFGNISLLPGIKLVGLELPPALLAHYRGPRFGQLGLRALLDAYDRPLLCTALKPMGLSADDLAALAYRLARGGIDLIKDDHGLADQPFCPFAERVPRCAAAVARANRESGGRCLYLPNVTAPAHQIVPRARLAKESGAGGLLFCPGLGGIDALRLLADDDTLALPLLAHPAWLGGLGVGREHGIAHEVLYGTLLRLAGADATIFPSFGGRFAFTRAECRAVVAGATRPLGALRPIFPVPAGGIRLDRSAELYQFYGPDCIWLIGGDLHRDGDPEASVRRLRAALVTGSHWAPEQR